MHDIDIALYKFPISIYLSIYLSTEYRLHHFSILKIKTSNIEALQYNNTYMSKD